MPASVSDSWVEPSPAIAARPSALARSRAAGLGSMTTIRSGSMPLPSSVLTAARPLVPYPQTIVWSCKFLLHLATRIAWRLRSASISKVVPTSRIKNRIRAGVTRIVVASRASSETGRTSP